MTYRDVVTHRLGRLRLLALPALLVWVVPLVLPACTASLRTPDPSSAAAERGALVAASDTVFGQLLVIWADARDETTGAPTFFAADSSGTTVRLLMEPDLLSPLGGPTRLNRAWLSFIGRPIAGDSPALQVIAVVRAPDR